MAPSLFSYDEYNAARNGGPLWLHAIGRKEIQMLSMKIFKKFQQKNRVIFNGKFEVERI